MSMMLAPARDTGIHFEYYLSPFPLLYKIFHLSTHKVGMNKFWYKIIDTGENHTYDTIAGIADPVSNDRITDQSLIISIQVPFL